LEITLIIGGARSGKSDYAQQLALESGKKVLFVATAGAGDEEMRRRIEKHRQGRPASWATLEATTGVGAAVRKNVGGAGIIIVDCITLLVSNVFGKFGYETDGEAPESSVEKEVVREVRELIDCVSRLEADFVIVTNEVGMDLVPANPAGRLYRDLLGKANQMLAKHAGRVILMVAGIPLQVKPEKHS
jgi:adenosylcobinamide kinase/adenosylcobinamide-phosphate guanylyltransferase